MRKEKLKADEEKRVTEIKAHNDRINAQIAEINTVLAKQKQFAKKTPAKFSVPDQSLRKQLRLKAVDWNQRLILLS